jgi:hypothetical protein
MSILLGVSMALTIALPMAFLMALAEIRSWRE